MTKSFCFVLSHLDVKGSLPLELIPGHTFEKATVEQVKKIKQLLHVFDAFKMLGISYEIAVVAAPGSKPGHKKFSHKPLLPENWRYWVVNFLGNNAELEDLEIAAGLPRNELQFGFSFLRGFGDGEAMLFPATQIFHYYNRTSLFPPEHVTITTDELKQIGPIYSMLKSLKVSWPNIYRTACRFHSLKTLPHNSDFLVIAYFSVIESLITHAPELTEPMDSLTHQMKTKMKLLAKRVPRPFEYESFFNSENSDKIWGKLYAYRSKLAHGGTADFAKELNLLSCAANAQRFLKEAAKILLLCALKEPELVTDLKSC